MAMFALASVTLINDNDLKSVSNAKQIWYADDAVAAGCIDNLAKCGQKFVNMAPLLVTMSTQPKHAMWTRKNTYSWQLTPLLPVAFRYPVKGPRYLGAPLGADNFVRYFVSQKVSEWQSSVEKIIVHC